MSGKKHGRFGESKNSIGYQVDTGQLGDEMKKRVARNRAKFAADRAAMERWAREDCGASDYNGEDEDGT